MSRWCSHPLGLSLLSGKSLEKIEQKLTWLVIILVSFGRCVWNGMKRARMDVWRSRAVVDKDLLTFGMKVRNVALNGVFKLYSMVLVILLCKT